MTSSRDKAFCPWLVIKPSGHVGFEFFEEWNQSAHFGIDKVFYQRYG